MLADNMRWFGHWVSLNFCISVSLEQKGFLTIREHVCLSHAQEAVLESKDAKTTGTGNGDEEEVDL